MDPASLLGQALALVRIAVEHAQLAKCNRKHAEWLAERARAFEGTIQELGKKQQSLTHAQTQGLQILVKALDAANEHAREVEQRAWYVAMYKSKDDQRRFLRVEQEMASAAQLLQVAMQVDQRAMLEAVNDDLRAQFDAMREHFDKQTELHAETKVAVDKQTELHAQTKDSIEEMFKEMFMLMQTALASRGGEQKALEEVIDKHLAKVSVAIRNDPGVRASDLGVRSKEAFVVGVAKYEGQPLANSTNDARMVAAALRRCDFRVLEVLDPTFDDFDDARNAFEARLGPGTLAVFYFSGHGLEYDSQNFLLMQDLRGDADERDVKRKYGYPAQDLLKGMVERRAAFNLLILDACRTVNVKRSTRAVAQGLGAMDVPLLENAGSLIAFATAANAVAYDGDGDAKGRNGMFTKHLLNHMETPKPIHEMMFDVQIAVKEACAGKQVPWISQHFGSHEAKSLQLIDASQEEVVTGEARVPARASSSKENVSRVHRGTEAHERWNARRRWRKLARYREAAHRFREAGARAAHASDNAVLHLPEVARRKLETPQLELSTDERLEVIEACIAAGKQQAARAMGKQLIMVIGNTGAGKSTLVNYLHGCRMESHKQPAIGGGSKKMHKVIRVAEDSDPPVLMEIGHANMSATFMPKVAGGDGAFTFADCPGFLDNRGAEINIANAVNIREAVSRAQGIRVLIVLNYHSLKSDRGRGIKELAQILADLFGDARRMHGYAGSVLLGLSRAPIKDDDDDPYDLVDFEDLVRDTSGLGDESASIVRALADKLFVYDPLDRGTDTWRVREQILADLRSLPPISEPGDVFRTVLTAEDERALRSCVTELSRRLQKGMEGKQYTFVASTLRQLNALESIENSLVSRLLARARERVVAALVAEKDDAVQNAMTRSYDVAEKHIQELMRAANALESDGGAAAKSIASRVHIMAKSAAAAVANMRRMDEEHQRMRDQYDELEQQMRALEERAREDREFAEARVRALEKERAQSERERREMAQEFEVQRRELEERMAESGGAEERRKMQEEIRRLEAERDAQDRDAREAFEARERQLRQQAEASAKRASAAEEEKKRLQKEKAEKAREAEEYRQRAAAAARARNEPSSERKNEQKQQQRRAAGETGADAIEAVKRAEREGNVEAVVAAMQRHAGDAGVQQWACRALHNLSANNPANTTRAGNAGGVEAVVAAMQRHANNADVQEQACWALNNLSANNPANTTRAGNAGGVEAVVAAMQRHANNADVQYRACGALVNLSVDNPGNTTRAGNAGGVEAVVAAMQRHANNADVQEQACRALINLSANNPANKTRAGNAGGVEAVVAAMQRHANNADVQEQACWALVNLSVDNPGNTTRAGNAGGVEAVVAAMQRHANNADVQGQACRALINLSFNNSGNTTRAGNAGGVEAIVAAMQRHATNADVQEQACRALFNLSANNPANTTRAGNAGGVEAVVAAMQRHANNADVQQWACRALINLSDSDTNARRAAAAGAVQALTAAKRYGGETSDKADAALEYIKPHTGILGGMRRLFG